MVSKKVNTDKMKKASITSLTKKNQIEEQNAVTRMKRG